MSLDLSDFVIIIGCTSAIVTGSTTAICYGLINKLKDDICNKIENLLVRVGVLEESRSHESN
jgi:hypothetical protein